MAFQCSAYPTTQALSLPLSQGVGAINNKKANIKETWVTLMKWLMKF